MQNRDGTKRGSRQAFTASWTHPGWGEFYLQPIFTSPSHQHVNILVYLYILSNSSIYLFDYCRIPTYWCLFHSLIAFYVNIYNPVTNARISTRPFEGIFHICLPSLFRTKHCYVLLLLLSKHHQLLVNKQL